MLKRLILLIIGLALLTACNDTDSDSLSPSATIPIGQVRVVVREAMIFKSPSRDSDVLFRLVEGDQLPILAYTTPDLIGVLWYQVGQGDEFGWIAGSQVEVIGDVSSVRQVDFIESTPVALVLSPTPPTTPDTPTPIYAQITVTAAQTPLLDDVQPDSPRRGMLTQGESAEIIGRLTTETGDYYLVGRDRDILGWVAGTDVALAGDLSPVPLVSLAESSVSGILGTSTPSPTQPPTLPPTNTPRQAQTEHAGPAQPTPETLFSFPTIESTAATQSAERPTPPPEIMAGVAPPLTLTLPPEWGAAYFLVPINNETLRGQLPVALYQGPLEGGITGSLWVIWGFPNIASPSGQLNLYGDGVQLLRGMLFDSLTCNLGLGTEPGAPPAQFIIGEQTAIGAIYSAVDCEGTPDTSGFFTVIQQNGQNFAFFAGVEPATRAIDGIKQIEAILKTVRFDE